jgi:dTDP-4-amino-4,6-dideoxygalactose transaminase
MNIPTLDLKRQYQEIKNEIDASIQRVVDSQRFILGDEVTECERRVADYCGTKHAIGVASGTDALLLSVRALVSRQSTTDKIITSTFTFFATAGAIVNAGAQPVFIDIDPLTYNIDTRQIEKYLNTNPDHREEIKAIMPVHLYGQMADMEPVIEIAEKYNLKIIEDAAQSFGAEYNGKKAGAIGDLGCFSFFPSKNLSGYGDGGMIITDDDELAEKIRLIRVHGSKNNYFHPVIGYNSRLDALQAAVVNTKLPHLETWLNARRQNATTYNEKLKNLPAIETPATGQGCLHTYNQYTIFINDSKRDDLKHYLKQKGIDTAIYYPLPLHLQECFMSLGYRKGALPHAEKAAEHVLSLPVFPELSTEEIEYVCEHINNYFN